MSLLLLLLLLLLLFAVVVVWVFVVEVEGTVMGYERGGRIYNKKSVNELSAARSGEGGNRGGQR